MLPDVQPRARCSQFVDVQGPRPQGLVPLPQSHSTEASIHLLPKCLYYLQLLPQLPGTAPRFPLL